MNDQEPAVANRDDRVMRAARIARHNDILRQRGEGGVIVVTLGARALPSFDAPSLLLMLQTYDGFDEDNDPHGEHDFGDVEWPGGISLLWKIDYYDEQMEYASPDPANAGATKRILTVMLASEY